MIPHQDIEALIDGELDKNRAEKLIEKIKSDADLQQKYESLKHQKELLKLWWSKQSQH